MDRVQGLPQARAAAAQGDDVLRSLHCSAQFSAGRYDPTCNGILGDTKYLPESSYSEQQLLGVRERGGAVAQAGPPSEHRTRGRRKRRATAHPETRRRKPCP